MKDKIRLLIKLQDCDNKISEIISKKREGPLKIQRLKDELGAIEMKFREEGNKLDALKKERRQVEQEIQDLESKIDKSTTKLDNIKSNKEYKAALKEVEDLKKAKFLTEEKTIQLMEAIEELERKGQENRDQQIRLEQDFEKDRLGIEQELKELNAALEEFEKMSRTFSEALDQELLRRYRFIRDRRAGQAVSPVVSGVCQTCHMGIPPQKFNELIRGNELMTCPHCNRLIYWGEDQHFQEAQEGV